MKAILTFFTILMVPIFFLNFFAVFGSGIWLIVLGNWKIVLLGVFLIIFSTYGLGFAMMPSLLLLPPFMYCIKHNNRLGMIFFSFLNSLYTIGLITIWCMAILYLFLNMANERSFLPTIIWSYSVAIGPWVIFAQKDQEGGSNEYSIQATLLACSAYIVTMLRVIFSNSTFMSLLIVFAIIMTIGIIIQTTIVFIAYNTDDLKEMFD